MPQFLVQKSQVVSSFQRLTKLLCLSKLRLGLRPKLNLEMLRQKVIRFSSANFTGETVSADDYYAAYPYNVNTRWYYTYKDFSIPFKANQKANGLKNGILVAKASDGNLDFAHVCGYVKFTIFFIFYILYL